MTREGLGGITAAAILCLATAGCATTQTPEPIIKTVTVFVPVVGACVPATLGPEPTYPDSDEALKSVPPGLFQAPTRFQMLIAGRLMRIARNHELATVVAGCPKAAPK